MKILVFGATGETGKAFIRRATAAGHQTTAFVRDPQKLGITHPSLRVIKGDIFNSAEIGNALEGQDAVLTTLGSRPWKPSPVCSQAAAVLLPAMNDEEVKRLVCISAFGIAETRPLLWAHLTPLYSIVLRAMLSDKERQEELIRESEGIDWVLVRPVLLTGGRGTGTWDAVTTGRPRSSMISRDDVAAFALEQCTSLSPFLHQAVAISRA